MAIKRAVIYLRVSSAGQTRRAESSEGYSIEAQREACMNKAGQLDAEVVAEYVDAGQSARTADRDALQRMVAQLEADRRIDYVIVHKIDRLARSRHDDVLLTLAIRNAGAQLVSVSENIDETPHGALVHGILASVAEFYSRNLANEVVTKSIQKAKLGGTPSAVPLGYLNVRSWEEGRDIRTVEVDPERAPHVQWAFSAYATGEWTIRQLVEALWNRGLRTRETKSKPAGKASRSVVARLLANPYYIGVVRYRGVEYAGRHERLISSELFEQVQEVLRTHDVAGEKLRVHPHYLKGTIFCGWCGRRFLYQRAVGRRGGVYWYFMCSGRHAGTGCEQPYVPAELAEEAVADYYGRGVVLPAKQVAEYKQLLREGFRELRANKDAERKRLRRRMERVETKRRKLLHAHLAGAVPLELLRDEQQALESECRVLSDELKIVELEGEHVEASLERALDLGTDAQVIYLRGNDQERRRLNQTFFRKVLLRDREIIGAELADPYATLLSEELADDLAKVEASPSRSFRGGSRKTRLVGPLGLEPSPPD